MTRILIALFIFVSMPAFAQDDSESSVNVSRSETEQVSPKPSMPFKVFVDGYPVPLWSGGVGVAAEYALSDRWSAFAGLGRKVQSTAGGLNLTFEKETKVSATNRILGARFYVNSAETSGFYANAGYKWSDLYIEHNPAMLSFSPRATKRVNANGAMGGFGYRISANKRKNFQWLVDIGANYEPGNVKNVRYTGSTLFLAQDPTAEVDADIAYGLFPEVRIGVQF